ncbi:MAG: hypothetical protein ACP5O6_04030 [Candidatus Baltobacteraceae bacterium]
MKRLALFCASLALALGLAYAPTLAYTRENGVIILRNRTSAPVKIVEIRHMVGSLPGIVIDRDLTVPPHQTVYANRCCYAAGSDYRITAEGSGQTVSHVVQVRMKSCPVGNGNFGIENYASFAVELMTTNRGELVFINQGPACE